MGRREMGDGSERKSGGKEVEISCQGHYVEIIFG